MGLLDKQERSAIPSKDFAGPGRSFPIENKAHAKAAIMDSKFAPPAQRAKIVAKAKAKLRK
jgi:hypothetical protein